jgi:hypothetical protein
VLQVHTSAQVEVHQVLIVYHVLQDNTQLLDHLLVQHVLLVPTLQQVPQAAYNVLQVNLVHRELVLAHHVQLEHIHQLELLHAQTALLVHIVLLVQVHVLHA